MKAVVIHEYIKDVAEVKDLVREWPEPKPDFSKGEVLVEVKVSSLNFFDILQMQGKYQTQPPRPFIAGFEFSGVIKTAGKDCPLPVGTRICASTQGGYAEKIVVPWKDLIKVPENVSFEEAAGIYVTYPTAYAGLINRGELKKGEWCLVHAAAGGVGLSACQIAKAVGAKVIACASADKHEVCTKYGKADYCVDYDKKDWEKDVKQLTGGKGVNVVLDPIGAIRQSLKCIAWKGRVVVIGFAAGQIEQVPANLILLKNIAVTGLFWGAHVINEPEAIPIVWKAILDMFAKGDLKTVVYDRKFEGLEQIHLALQDMWERKSWGKAMITHTGQGKL